MKSQYEGLWKSERTGWYCSKPMTQADIKKLPKKCRILMRYNKYYEKDSNKPNFIFAFADAEGMEAVTIESDKKEYVSELDSIKSKLSEIRSYSIYGQDSCENYDEPYRYLSMIEDLCNEFLY